MACFDCTKVARAAGIPSAKLAELRRSLRREFPRDDMMYELHLLRACMAIRKGWITLEEALAPAGRPTHGVVSG